LDRHEIAFHGRALASAERFFIDILEVEGRPLPNLGLFPLRFVGLDASDLRRDFLRINLNAVAHADLAGEDGPGDNRSESMDGEDAIDRHPEKAAVLALLDAAADFHERRFDFRDACFCHGGNRNDRRPFED
jgi:hypothetical protein